MGRARALIQEVAGGVSPIKALEKVLGPAGPYPVGMMASVFQFIKQHPGSSVDDVLKAFPALANQRAEIPQWISDTLQGREII